MAKQDTKTPHPQPATVPSPINTGTTKGANTPINRGTGPRNEKPQPR